MKYCGQLHASTSSPLGKELPISLGRRLGGPQSQSQRCRGGKNNSPLPEIEPCPSRSYLVSIPTELSRLLLSLIDYISKPRMLNLWTSQQEVLTKWSDTITPNPSNCLHGVGSILQNQTSFGLSKTTRYIRVCKTKLHFVLRGVNHWTYLHKSMPQI
jgi:hypothetical protein